jgi:hypothetical protein
VTLTTARAIVRQFARNAQDSSMYDTADVDRAIAFIGTRFCRVTKCVKTKTAMTALTISSAALPAFPTGFRPERLIRAYITDYPMLRVVDTDLLRRWRNTTPRTDTPEMIAFDSQTTGEVYPTPVAASVITLLWWESFTTFTAGTATPDAVTLNIPEDILNEILVWGPPCVLQWNDPEHGYASSGWQKYLELENSLRSIASIKVTHTQRVLDEDGTEPLIIPEGE